MTKSIGELVYELSLDNKKLQAQLKKQDASISKSGKTSGKKYGGGFSSGLGSLTSLFNPITLGIAGVTTAVVGSFNVFKKFGKTMSEVKAVSGGTASEMDMLGKKAKELGVTTEKSATEVGQGLIFLSRAGLEAGEQIKAIGPALDFATANNIELGKSADIATNIMGQFGKTVEDLPQVMDVLSKTTASSNTNVNQLAEAMKYAGPTAKAMGISIEEMSATIGILGNNGLQGSLATRALGTSLTRLAKPTGEMKGLMSDLGLEFFNAQGEFIGLSETIGVLEEGTAGMTEKQQQATLSTLFGAEAIQEMNILMGAGSEELARYTGELENSKGTTEDMANTMRDNLQGSLDNLKSAFEGLGIAIGEGGSGPLRIFIDLLTSFVRTITSAGGPLGALSEKMNNFLDSVLGIERPIEDTNKKLIEMSEKSGNLKDQFQELEDQFYKNIASYEKGIITKEELNKKQQELEKSGASLDLQYRSLQAQTQAQKEIEEERTYIVSQLDAIENDSSMSMQDKARISSSLRVELASLDIKEQELIRTTTLMNGQTKNTNAVMEQLSTAKTRQEFENLKAKQRELVISDLNLIKAEIAKQKVLLSGKERDIFEAKAKSSANAIYDSYQKMKNIKFVAPKAEGATIDYTPSTKAASKSAKSKTKIAEAQAKEEKKIAENLIKDKIKIAENDVITKKTKINNEITDEEERARKIKEIENQLKIDKLNIQGDGQGALLEESKQRATLYDKIKDKGVEAEEEINDKIDESKDKLAGYREKLTEIEDGFDELDNNATTNIQRLNGEMETLKSGLSGDLASRFAEINKSLEGETDDTKKRQLEEEKALIIENTTEEERKEAVRVAGLSTAESLIEKEKEKLAILQEQKFLAEQVKIATSGKEDGEELDTGFSTKINEETGVLEAFYLNKEGMEVQATDQKSIQYITDTLNKQTELNNQLLAEQEKVKAEELLQTNLLEKKKGLSNQWMIFLQGQKNKELAVAQELYNKRKEVYNMRQKAGAGGGVTSRATGGPLVKGQTSFVGEQGIELFKSGGAYQLLPPGLFTPQQSGTVINNRDTQSIINKSINLGGLNISGNSGMNEGDLENFLNRYMEEQLSGNDRYRK